MPQLGLKQQAAGSRNASFDLHGFAGQLVVDPAHQYAKSGLMVAGEPSVARNETPTHTTHIATTSASSSIAVARRRPGDGFAARCNACR